MPAVPQLFRVSLLTLSCLIACHALADEPPSDSPTDNSVDSEVKPDQPGEKRLAHRPSRTQRKPSNKEAKDSNQDKIEVSGHKMTDTEERRRSTAAKLVFGRQELDRYGDSSVGEVLKRLPGVTISGIPGRGGDIRMRGLGNGYTQILINGEPMPPGFSIDQLAPEQVERIEILRAPVAEFSAQAIAGTINIVLREEPPKAQMEFRSSVAEERGYAAPNVSIMRSDTIGPWSYLVSISVFKNSLDNQLTDRTVAYLPSGALVEDQIVHDDNRSHGDGVHAAPRITYRFDNGDTLMLQPFVTQSHHYANGTAELQEPVSDPDAGFRIPYTSSYYQSESASSMARVFANWQHKFNDGGKLTIKLGGGASHSESDLYRDQFNAIDDTTNFIVNDTDSHDRRANTGGKYTEPLADGQTLALGWDGEWTSRTQGQIYTDNGVSLLGQYGNNLTADTRRLDAFAQDDWDINAQWAAYAGIRWEGIETRSDTLGGSISNSSSVWSPMLHGVYRLPDSDKDQIRLGITRSYRAPSLGNLIAVPTYAVINTPTSPDTVGNPNLKPELAWGVDLAYEHYLEQDGMLSASLFGRSIDNLMRSETTLQNGRWVSMPYNIGNATTTGVELDAKTQLSAFVTGAPDIQLRANYSHFWSHVDGIPGPNNRLSQQPKQTANIGFDYKLGQVPLTLGANFNWTPAFFVQTSPEQYYTQGNKRVLDAYGLWKFNSRTQLRVSATNALHQDYVTGNGLDGEGVDQLATVTAQTYVTWTAKLEVKF